MTSHSIIMDLPSLAGVPTLLLLEETEPRTHNLAGAAEASGRDRLGHETLQLRRDRDIHRAACGHGMRLSNEPTVSTCATLTHSKMLSKAMRFIDLGHS